MFHFLTTRNSAIGYLFWRWIFRSCGAKVSQLDASYFGPNRGMNDYDSLASSYSGSNVKPDKLYSILPTVMKIAGSCVGKSVIDMGCGAGFFTQPFAESGASYVCGVDSSVAQIDLARRVAPHPSIKYVVADVFTQYGGPADIVCVPFVANYARTVPILNHFFSLVYKSLCSGGRAVFVLDLPNGKSLKRFGAVKTFSGSALDETPIQIHLYNREQKICELTSIYYTPETIERLLKGIGFKNICWHVPIVSQLGIQTLGEDFWKGYTTDPELGYLTAEK